MEGVLFNEAPLVFIYILERQIKLHILYLTLHYMHAIVIYCLYMLLSVIAASMSMSLQSKETELRVGVFKREKSRDAEV